MAAEHPLARVGLPRSYVSCKLCVLAGHRSDEGMLLEAQRRYDLNGGSDWVLARYVTDSKPS